MLKFSEEHEWLLVEGDVATVGITDYAQKALGDVVFVELPEVGTDIAKGDEAGVVESVKAASEIYSAITGVVTEINDALEADPSLVNTSPMDDGWFFKMSVADSAELDALMDQAAYDAFVAGLD